MMMQNKGLNDSLGPIYYPLVDVNFQQITMIWNPPYLSGIPDGGLQPLTRIPTLEHVSSAYWFPREQFAALREMPNMVSGSAFDLDTIEQCAPRRRRS